jgi:phospholipid/cholesterol/gamma-HCH transport system permease protein
MTQAAPKHLADPESPPTLVDRLAEGPSLFVSDLRALGALLMQTFYYLFRGQQEKGAIVKQAYVIGNESLLFVTVTMMVIGMIMVVQSALQALKVVPDLSMLGGNIIQMMTRDFAATICAMMLATRVGAGIAAEIGSMVVTEQVDALRMSAADPVEYLVVPRFVASIVMTTALTFWSLFVALAAGMVTANLQFDVSYATFLNFSFVKVGDLVLCLMKAVAYGAAIPIVSAYRGLSTFGGSEGVGWATTSAVVHSSLAVIMLDLVLSVFGYFVFPP